MRTDQNHPMDDATRRLLRNAGMEEPAPDFTSRIMQRIEPANAAAFIYTPVIGRRAWIVSFLLVAVVLLLTIYIFPSASSAGSTLHPGLQTGLVSKLSGLVSSLSTLSILPGLAGAAIAGWLLMAIDKRRLTQNLTI